MAGLDLNLLQVALLAGILGLDSAAAVQVMVSRPLVAGWLTGLVCGDGMTGLAMGCLLELMNGGMLPVGAYVPPDHTLSTVVTVAGTLRLTGPAPGVMELPFDAVMVTLLLCAVPLGWLGGQIDVWVRRLNVNLSHWAEARAALGEEDALHLAMGGALLVTFLKPALLALAVLGLVVPALGRLLVDLPQPVIHGLTRMSWLMLVLGLAVMADLFWNRKLAPLFFGAFATAWLLIHLMGVPLLWMVPLSAAAGVTVGLLWRPAEGATR
jgi:mannose/fructose/N-acetylgalactosamine-specific phosphotransferase system component IIC